MSIASASSPKRVLYFYPHLNVDTGSPMVLLRMVEGLDRRRFKPFFLSRGEGPLTEALRERQVEIIRGNVDELTQRAPMHGARAVFRQRALLRDHKIDLLH